VPQVAVFDTAFHHTLPEHAYLCGLPWGYYEELRVRRYGFHGTSRAWVSRRAAEYLGRRPEELRIVSCHLGNGASLCVVDRGQSVDTTMGFTPAEGLIMGTRCGDVDAGVLAFLERERGLTAGQSEEILNRASGLLGLSGISSDMREALQAADAGVPRAVAAVTAARESAPWRCKRWRSWGPTSMRSATAPPAGSTRSAGSRRTARRPG
jgi:acetate kinase